MKQEKSSLKYWFLAGVATITLIVLFKPELRMDSPAASSLSRVMEKRLQDGRVCRVVLYYDTVSNEIAATVERLEVFVNDVPAHVPPECLLGVSNVFLGGIQIADFAQDIYLLLTGEQNGSACHVKLTVREGGVVERESTHLGRPPETTRYTTPWQVHEMGRISSAEKEKYFRDHSTTTNRKSAEP